MGNIHFVKDGSGDGHAAEKKTLPASELASALKDFIAVFYESAPTMNVDRPVSKESAPKHVVVEISIGEENEKFPNAGYYHIANLGPSQCARMFSFYY